MDVADLATGDAEAGRRYFNGAGGCSGCHSATGDLAGIASRYQGLALLQRMLYPSGQPAPARPKVTLTLASGQTRHAPLAGEDEFTITILDPAGARQTYAKERGEVQDRRSDVGPLRSIGKVHRRRHAQRLRLSGNVEMRRDMRSLLSLGIGIASAVSAQGVDPKDLLHPPRG